MEDEESTDDADECEDEPMAKSAALQLSNASTSAAFPVRPNGKDINTNV